MFDGGGCAWWGVGGLGGGGGGGGGGLRYVSVDSGCGGVRLYKSGWEDYVYQ